MFHIISQEQTWRKQQGRPEGFDMLTTVKPIVAVGAEKPLEEGLDMADFFRTWTLECCTSRG